MRDLNLYATKAMEMLDNLNIPYVKTEIRINNRLKSTWGLCHSKMNRITGECIPTHIDINPILLDERNEEKGLINTICHELLHTVEGCQNHGEKWKRYASKVNNFYGLNIKRGSSDEDKGISEEVLRERRIKKEERYNDRKYVVICEKCGAVVRKYSYASNVWKYPAQYIHGGTCHGRLKRRCEPGDMMLLSTKTKIRI